MTKERIIFISLLLILLILRNFNFNNNKKWSSENKSSYLYSGKYKISLVTQEEIDNLPTISEDNAILIMLNKDRIKKDKNFSFIKGIGDKKDKILKKYIILE